MLWLPLIAQVRALRARGVRNGNPFVNGAMRIAQRGVSGALSTTPAIVSLDGWWAVQNAAANGFIQQQVGSAPAGFSHRLRCGRTAGSALTGAIQVAAAAESLDCTRFQGKVCNLNFWALKGANYSAAANVFQAALYYSTGTDLTVLQLFTGAWPGLAAAAAQNVNLTAGWTRYSMPVAIPAAATQLAVVFTFNPTGVAGADDSFYLTGIQLNEGAWAAPYDNLYLDEDLSRCLRRLPVFDAANGTGDRWNGFATSTTVGVFYQPFPVVARVPITGLIVPDATKWTAFGARTGTSGPCNSAALNGSGQYTAGVSFGFPAGTPNVVAGDFLAILPNSTAAKVIYTGAEL